MTKSLALVALLACLWTGAIAQKKSKPAVSNLQANADGKRLKVTYTLVGTAPTDSVYLQVESRTRGVLPLKTVTGDVGKNLESGTTKTIYWDYALDGIKLDEFRTTVNVKQAKSPPEASNQVAVPKETTSTPTNKVKALIGGGPTYAVLSALAPGVGNIFVQPTRKIGLRPLVTVSYVGLLAYGITQKIQSNKQYDLYTAEPNEQNAQPYYDAANKYHQRYYLATRAAAVILLGDVTFTLIRGLHNQKLRRQGGAIVSLQYQGTTPTLAFRHTF